VHGYKYDDIPWLLTGTDVGIVPSVWWDNGPQTVIEYLACGVPVVGARLGGIPDFVDHGRNGLLFEGNNRCDLARTLASIVAEPRILDTLRAGARGTRIKTMAEHAAELEGLYALARP
jgi:glycosyltransferase involved in cell wall biosynthesis